MGPKYVQFKSQHAYDKKNSNGELFNKLSKQKMSTDPVTFGFKTQKFTCVFARTLRIWCDINPEETMHNVLLISEITGATFCVCVDPLWIWAHTRERERETETERDREEEGDVLGGQRF